jgi:small subunit ribosomal protein S14
MAKQKKGSQYKVRAYNRCKLCGRPRAYMGKLGLCRICFRDIFSNIRPASLLFIF